jgi:hypothetical protein
VNVNTGTLGGKGIIDGVTTIGTGSASGAFLAPALGTKKQATLTIQNALTFNSDATYTCTFKAKKNKARSETDRQRSYNQKRCHNRVEWSDSGQLETWRYFNADQ